MPYMDGMGLFFLHFFQFFQAKFYRFACMSPADVVVEKLSLGGFGDFGMREF